jgi:hypothetical protein
LDGIRVGIAEQIHALGTTRFPRCGAPGGSLVITAKSLVLIGMVDRPTLTVHQAKTVGTLARRRSDEALYSFPCVHAAANTPV